MGSADGVHEAGVEYALVGGYAIAALSRLPDAAAAELLDDPDVFAKDKGYAIRINDEFTIDVMPSIAGLTWTEMQPHVTTLDIGGSAVRVLDLAGLLKTKQGVRPKDQMDAAVLRAALEKRGKP